MSERCFSGLGSRNSSHTGRSGFKAPLPLVGHPKGNKCLARKKVFETKWEKVMTTFLEKTTLFRDFGHKMHFGGIFFIRKILVHSVLQ